MTVTTLNFSLTLLTVKSMPQGQSTLLCLWPDLDLRVGTKVGTHQLTSTETQHLWNVTQRRWMPSATPAGLNITMTWTSMLENSLKSLSECSAPLPLTSFTTGLCPVSTQPPSHSLTAGTATSRPSDWLSCCQINHNHAPLNPATPAVKTQNYFTSERERVCPETSLVSLSLILITALPHIKNSKTLR